MRFFQLVLKNMQDSSFRTWVVLLCATVVAGFSLSIVIILRGAEDSLRLASDRMGADIIVVPRGTETKVSGAILMGRPVKIWMPADTVQKIAAIPGVAVATPQIYLSTMKDAPCCAVSEMFVVVYDPATDFVVEPWLKSNLGQDLKLGEAIGGRYVFVPPGQTKIEMYGYYVDLRGNMEPTGSALDQTMFMNVDTAREMAKTSLSKAQMPLTIPENSVSTVLIRLQADADADLVATQIQKQVPGVSPMVGLSLFDSFRAQIGAIRQAMILVLGATAGLSLLLLGLVFSMAANERRRQIGVLRALGATRIYILESLLAEAATLAAVGGVVGVALAALIVSLFGSFIVSSLGFPFLYPSVGTMAVFAAGGLAAALLCVTLASFLPAFSISRREPALAMRE